MLSFFPSAGYQAYKKAFGVGSPDQDSEAPSLEGGDGEDKEKDYAVENSAFELDENVSSGEKEKNMNKNTQL